MSSILDIARAAAQLRHDLKLAQLPELKLLCGLSFFDSVISQQSARLESYVREFIPALAIAAEKSDPGEFLPDETQTLERLIELLKRQPDGVVSPDDINALSCLAEKIAKGPGDFPTAALAAGSPVRVTCLFVEHYPDLDLSPRGRILNLTVTAPRISTSAEEDDIVVRNPVSEPDDRFLAQARDSINAARTFLLTRYNLPANKRYRFDYAVESTGARFTGDSLGVAFAVGAIVALARTEVLRDRLAVSPSVAFSGALSVDGRLSPVDSDALRLKIYRAFHSNLTLLLIPREHLADAQAQVLDLEKQHPGQKLDLAGVQTIESVVSDPRLVVTERSSTAAYIARKAWKAKRSVWVEVPALLVLLAVLFYLVAPARYMPWFDDNPTYLYVNSEDDRIDIYNDNRQKIWSHKFPCDLNDQIKREYYENVTDINGDGRNEVAYIPVTSDSSKARSCLYVFSDKGDILFTGYCPIRGECPGDDSTTMYESGAVFVETINNESVIITIVVQNNPARSHYKFWNKDGDLLGWYINAGHGILDRTIDINGDGVEEVVFGGFNNAMGSWALFVLNCDGSYGVSPPYTSSRFSSTWPKRGNQKAYILFPKTDLGLVDLSLNYNSGTEDHIAFDKSDLLLRPVRESSVGEHPSDIFYYLNRSLRVVKAIPNDRFRKRHGELIDEGKLEDVDWGEYQIKLRDAVTYWTDSGWVTEGQLRAAADSR